MIIQVMMPTTIKSSDLQEEMAQYDERAKKNIMERRGRYAQLIQEAEAQIDEALNEGYQLLTQYIVKEIDCDSVTFVLWKPTIKPFTLTQKGERLVDDLFARAQEKMGVTPDEHKKFWNMSLDSENRLAVDIVAIEGGDA
jgi:hypothetical protein